MLSNDARYNNWQPVLRTREDATKDAENSVRIVGANYLRWRNTAIFQGMSRNDTSEIVQ